jgi:hypothetical protein
MRVARRMNGAFPSLVLSVLAVALPLQAAPPTWVHAFAGPTGQGSAALVQALPDGGFVFGGTTPSAAGDEDLWLFETDALGEVRWARTYGTANDDAGTIQPSPDGGFVALGSTLNGTGQVTGWWLLKTDASGSPVWQHALSASGGLTLFAAAAVADGVVVAGGPNSALAGYPTTLWLAKFDASGSLSWQRGLSPGFLGVVPLALVQALPGGDLLLSGTYGSMLTQDANLFLARTDPSGNIRWQGSYGGSKRDVGGLALVTADGGFLLEGATLSWGAGGTANGYGDAWVLRLDASGNILWQRAFGGPQDDLALVLPDPAGGYILSGFSTSFGSGQEDIFAAKLDAQGSILWQRAFGGAGSEAGFVVPDPAGGYLLQGTSDSFGSGGQVLWAAHLDGGGGVAWQKTYGGPGPDLLGMGFLAAANLLTQGFGILPDGHVLLSGETSAQSPRAFWAMRAEADGGIGAPCGWVTAAEGPTVPLAMTATTSTSQAAAGGFSSTSSALIVQASSLNTSQFAATASTLCAPPLSAAASASVLQGATPLSVDFEAGAAGGTPPYTCAWSFGDGAISSEVAPGHLYAVAGTYRVVLTVADAASRTATDDHLSILASIPVAPPVIVLVKKVSPPFKLVVMGSNLQSGIRVFIDGAEWTGVVWKNAGKIQLTGGIKAAVPRATTHAFRFLNPDGGEAATTWGW